MKKRIFFYPLFLYSLLLFSQEFSSLGEFEMDSLRFFHVDSQKLRLIFNKSTITIDKDSIYTSNLLISGIEDPGELNHHSFEVVYLNQSPFYVRKSLGDVYKYSNDSIFRVDNSSNLRSNSGAAKFGYKNKIYSLFGYGFFESNNLMLSFDEKSKEWSFIYPDLNSDIPLSRHNPIFHQTGDKVFILGGYQTSINDSEKRLQDLVELNLNTHSFKQLGENKNTKFKFNLTPGYGVKTDADKTLVITSEKTLLFDFKNLTYATSSIFDLNQGYSNFLAFEDYIYFLKNNKKNNLYYVGRMPKGEILKQFNNQLALVENKLWSKKNTGIILVVLFVISFINLFFKILRLRNFKKNKILKQGNYLTYNQKIAILTEEQSALLELLILKKDFIYLSEIMNLECFSEYSDSYKKIYVTKQIDELSKIVQNLITDQSNAISIKKRRNKFDKRIIEIGLDGLVVIYKGWLSYLFSKT